MAIIFGDLGTLGRSRREQSIGTIPASSPISMSSGGGGGGMHLPALPSPFGELSCSLSVAELRETAYEILVAACVISQTPAITKRPSVRSAVAPAEPGLQRTLSPAVKMALEMRPAAKRCALSCGGSSASLRLRRKPTTVEDLIRVQMRVSEQADSRIRKGLLRINSRQLGKHVESMVLPLELLQQFRAADFPDKQAFEAWQFRNLKVLEAGLLIHPRIAMERSEIASQRLWKIICGAADGPIETAKNSEQMQVLHRSVMALACRSLDGSASKSCHWADGRPLNLHLYQRLLEACFVSSDEGSVVEEIDGVMEMIRATWAVLGMNQAYHNLCLLWVLFQRFVTTGEADTELLFAADNHLAEVSIDARSTREPLYWKILASTLSFIVKWAENKLMAYHDTFDPDTVASMSCTVSIAISASEILAEDNNIADQAHHRSRKRANAALAMVDSYIRSSLRAAFARRIEKADLVMRSAKTQESSSTTLALSILAKDIDDLANKERDLFSPELKEWHPLAAGVAVATLHACYGNELKKFRKDVSELTNVSVHVLEAAEKLEKKLVLIAVEDSADSEDGGKAIIQEMAPFEARSMLSDLVKSWTEARVAPLKDWVGKNCHQESWILSTNKEDISPPATEVLATISGTLEAVFRLPETMHRVILPELVAGLDENLHQFVLSARSGCGLRNAYVPALPMLTRCEIVCKFWWKRSRSKRIQKRKSQVATMNISSNNAYLGLPELCMRINTLNHLRTELEDLQKFTVQGDDDPQNRVEIKFEKTMASLQEATLHLCESVGYRAVFDDLRCALWHGLYTGDASSSRINPFLKELEAELEKISGLVQSKVWSLALAATMRASFEGFLLVILAGGPARAFIRQDAKALEDDFDALRGIFLSGGGGLPEDSVDQASAKVKDVLPLFGATTESLIDRFKRMMAANGGGRPAVGSSKLSLPPTTGQLSSTEANTVLRVLCYRDEEAASRFLKKAYNFPTKLS